MLTLEYNEELAKKVQREEAIEEGIEKGIEETTVKVVRNALKKNLSISDIAELTGLTEEEVNALKESN